MGKGDEAVVDDKLRAHGLRNLRIVDASIMPNITSGNTNAPTIMIHLMMVVFCGMILIWISHGR